MKIRYINGRRLYYAFLAGGNAVIGDRDYLNKINVFPVPDADTGTKRLSSAVRSRKLSARSPTRRSPARGETPG
jgi:dihydroxyacetone kinase-like predicted kinase